MTFEEARARFPVLERYAYLNAGSVGPIARTTTEAVLAGAQADLERGRAGKEYFDELMAGRERLRAVLAAQLAVAPEQVALTNSTTQACNIVIAGLELGPDDEIVTTDVEHFGLIGPVHASRARVRVAAIRDRAPEEALEAILAERTPRTRLFALSHVAWTTGHVLPIEEVKRAEPDVPMLVDGAQSVGAIPVSAEPFDFYAVSGQKWLCGPLATGCLYVRDPEALRVALPSYLSQAAYEADGSFEPRPGAARFDAQLLAPGDMAGLVAAIESAPDWRFERARATAERCRELLAERVDVVTGPGHGTLVSFRAPSDAAELAARLYDAGVVVRDLPGTGWVRVSCGYWTSDGDLERLVESL